jgi:hypothetical protein
MLEKTKEIYIYCNRLRFVTKLRVGRVVQKIDNHCQKKYIVS